LYDLTHFKQNENYNFFDDGFVVGSGTLQSDNNNMIILTKFEWSNKCPDIYYQEYKKLVVGDVLSVEKVCENQLKLKK